MAENHEKLIARLKNKMPDEEVLFDLADLFKVFGDATRSKILSVLREDALCVNDIAEVLNMSVSAVSHQLRVLRDSKLVKATKMGKEVIYSLDDDHVAEIIDCGLSHINE